MIGAGPIVLSEPRTPVGAKQRARKGSSRDPGIQIVEEDGVRYLHIGGEAIQSGLRIEEPDRLELDYVRAMMAFLLLCPRPRDLLMVGLGGGSMARFVHQRMPQTRVSVVEINPEVVAVAREFFHFPQDDDRLEVVVADGAEVVPRRPGAADVLVVDGFEDGETPEALCTQAFYDAAFASLRDGGVMVVNFMADARKMDAYLERIEKSFGRYPTLLMAEDRDNLIAFAVRGGPQRISWDELKARALSANVRYGLQLQKSFPSLRRRNPSEDGFLVL
jgi:spermidine synthase